MDFFLIDYKELFCLYRYVYINSNFTVSVVVILMEWGWGGDAAWEVGLWF